METSEVWFAKHLEGNLSYRTWLTIIMREYSVMRVKSHSFEGRTIVLKSTNVVLKNSLKKLQITAYKQPPEVCKFKLGKVVSDFPFSCIDKSFLNP